MTEKENQENQEPKNEQEVKDEAAQEQVEGSKKAEEAPSEEEADKPEKEEPVAEEQEAAEEPTKKAETEEPAAEEQKSEEPVAQEAKAEETKEEEPAKAESKEEKVETAHDDFDWDIGNKRGARDYTDSRKEELLEMYEGTLNDVNENEIVTATVVGKTSSEAVLNIGFKSDGLVSLTEFRDREEDLKVGDEIEVYVVKKEDEKGQLVLSRKNAKLMRAWEQIVDAYENDKIVNGVITNKTKGGLITNVFGLETFLPGSQIDVKPIIDYDSYVGKKMEFKVVKINEAIKNAVVSHKALIESDLEAQRSEIISKLEKGQVLEGIIKNLTDFGAFIDLGGVDGLLYITDISWGRINHPSEVLELNQQLNVVVLDFDDEKKRISLGLKQLQPHPWDVLPEDIQIGSKVKGKVVNIEDYGAFLEIAPGVEGLVHISEVSWSNQPINSREFFKIGDEHDAIVMTLDKEERKMSLSIKQLSKDPWSDVKEKYAVGTKHSGEVKNITPYGVFIEMEEGIGGMIHISDLSWTKRFNHPSEFTKVGDTLEVVVLDIDEETRKLSLGHKQVEEDPWTTFGEVFPEGSVHEATVLRVEEKGAIVQLPYGLEAFAPMRHLKKEDGSTVQADETLDFKVLEFDKNDKKIIVSHSRIHEDEQRAGAREERKEKAKQTKKTQRTMKDTNKKVEKTTFGDLDVLSKLKEEMEETEKGGDSEKKETKKSKAKKEEKPKKAEKKEDETDKEEKKDEGED